MKATVELTIAGKSLHGPDVEPTHEALRPAAAKGFGCLFCPVLPTVRGVKIGGDYKGGGRDTAKDCRTHRMAGHGPTDARVMIVTERPSKSEDQSGEFRIPHRIAVGLENAGINPDEVRFTRAIRCYVPTSKKVADTMLRACNGYLAREIEKVDPEIIVVFGAAALRSVVGPTSTITASAGTPFRTKVCGKERIIFPMHSPAMLDIEDTMAAEWQAALLSLAKIIEGEATVLKGKGVYHRVHSADQAAAMLDAIKDGNVAIDFETNCLEPRDETVPVFKVGETKTGKPKAVKTDKTERAKISIVSWTTKAGQGKYVVLSHIDGGWNKADRVLFKNALRRLLLRRSVLKLFWNGVFECSWMIVHLGCIPVNFIDVMMLHHQWNENPKHKLKDAAQALTGMGNWNEHVEKYAELVNYNFSRIPLRLVGPYAGADVDATLRIFLRLRKKIDKRRRRLVWNLYPKLIRTIARMQEHGTRGDLQAAKVFEECTRREAAKRYDGILEIPEVKRYIRRKHRRDPNRGKATEWEFNVGSDAQVREILFKTYKYEPFAFTKGGEGKTDKESLNHFREKEKCPFATLLLEWRKYSKQHGTYALGLIDQMQRFRGFIHGHFLPHGTKCVVGGTKVLTEYGEIRMDRIVRHREVGWSDPPPFRVWDGQQWRQPVATYYAGRQQTVAMNTSDGGFLEGTHVHPILTPNGWCRLQDIREGDVVVRYRDGVPGYVKVSRLQYREAETFDLTMELPDVEDSLSFVQTGVQSFAEARDFGSRSGVGSLLREVSEVARIDAGDTCGDLSSPISRNGMSQATGARETPDAPSASRSGVCGKVAQCGEPQHAEDEPGILGEAGEQTSVDSAFADGLRRRSSQTRRSEESTGSPHEVLSRESRRGVGSRSYNGQDSEHDILDAAAAQGKGGVPNTPPQRTRKDGSAGSERTGIAVDSASSQEGSVCRQRKVVAATPRRQGDEPGFQGSGGEHRDRVVRRLLAPGSQAPAPCATVESRWYAMPCPVGAGSQGQPSEGGSANRSILRLTHAFLTNGFVSHNTGRLSSAGPNLQNQPLVARRMYVSRFGNDGCLVSADYSQIEVRVSACVSRDPLLLDVYNAGQDVHTATMCKIFGFSMEKAAKIEKKYPKRFKRLRTIAKRIVFGVIYGIGPQGVMRVLRSEGVHITEEEAQQYIDKFFNVYKRLRAWIDQTNDRLYQRRYTLSPFGRRRHLPAIRSADPKRRNRARRQGPNSVIQGAASDFTLTSMILIDRELEKRGMQSRIVINVHDSIVIDCLRSEAKEVARIVKNIMENIPTLAADIWGKNMDWSWIRCPIVAEVEVGLNWRDTVKFDPMKDSLRAKLKEAAAMQEEEDAKMLHTLKELRRAA